MDGRIMYGAPMKTSSFSAADLKRLDEIAANRLREKGYLVLPPGDTSPLGELVRSSVANMCSSPQESRAASLQKLDLVMSAARTVGLDPTIRAWVDRGRG